ncbi:type II toxin-antitoxin system HigB family toxin [Mesorhizobium amorphae]|uniref:type II toxin-antitoxin system HigB family toxin n=1 Tax=Mesorhizobium amorphae TaxID=71433 RepID=UPI0017863880
MQIVSRKTLVAFWTRHPQSRGALTAWYQVVDKVEWKTPADIKAQFGANVDFVSDNRTIFDIAGNKYRVIVHVSYTYKRVLIKFVGTRAEYDRIDAETV